MPVLPVLERPRQEELQFKDSLDYIPSPGQLGLYKKTLSQKKKWKRKHIPAVTGTH
jgi:hypothetical protein